MSHCKTQTGKIKLHKSLKRMLFIFLTSPGPVFR